MFNYIIQFVIPIFFFLNRRTKTKQCWGGWGYWRCSSPIPQGSLCQSQRWCERSIATKWDRLFGDWKDELSFTNYVVGIPIRIHLCSFSCFPMETLHSFNQIKRLCLIHCVSTFDFLFLTSWIKLFEIGDRGR